MPNPTDAILDHLDAVTDAIDKYGKTDAYPYLPELHNDMSVNTFRQYAPRVVAIAQRLYTDSHTTIARLREEIDALRARLAEVERQRDEALPAKETVVQADIPVPKTFQGWTVQRCKDGYVRMMKKQDGRVMSLHVGRVWDESKAAAKIAERMKPWTIGPFSGRAR